MGFRKVSRHGLESFCWKPHFTLKITTEISATIIVFGGLGNQGWEKLHNLDEMVELPSSGVELKFKFSWDTDPNPQSFCHAPSPWGQPWGQSHVYTTFELRDTELELMQWSENCLNLIILWFIVCHSIFVHPIIVFAASHGLIKYKVWYL